MDLMKAFTEKYTKAEPPVANVGDTVRVHLKVKEGNRERIQVFEGTVIAKKHGGIEETFTVRRVRWCAMVRSAAPSCTTCVAAWARLPRSKRPCNSSAKKERFCRSFFHIASEPSRTASLD